MEIVNNIGDWPNLSFVLIPEDAPSLCLRSLQTQGGDFDFPETCPILAFFARACPELAEGVGVDDACAIGFVT